MLFISAIHIKLAYGIDAKFIFLQLDFICTGCEPVRVHAYMIRECCREENDLVWLIARK